MKATPAHQGLLMQLQKLDTEIHQLNFKLKSLPEHEQITAIHSRLEHAAVELKVVETELEDVTIDLRRSEVDVEAVTMRMEKDEKRLNAGLGTPKELEQTQHELATLAKRKAELEDGELEIMMRHEGVKKRVDELKSDEEGLKKLELELNIRIENATTELNVLIAKAAEDRMKLAPQIDKALLDIYEKVRESQGGVGAALLIGNKCDGCHLQINAVELERIKTLADDDVLRCEECRRILVRM
ncbi:MAG: C4-type zinc ribbon domain-containing protein [Actinomycetes bacterium]